MKLTILEICGVTPPAAVIADIIIPVNQIVSFHFRDKLSYSSATGNSVILSFAEP